MGKIIGIDLGTTYSAVAALHQNKAEIIPDKNGRKNIPSIVSFFENQIYVGADAKDRELSSPSTTIKRIKRKMGTDEKIKIKDKEYTPEEISSFILRHLKEQAEEFLGEKVEEAIITVPAYFNDNQRQATKNAGKLAGLNVIRIINEPTAASLAYGVQSGQDLNVIIYDLGGGTFDVSVLNIAEGVFEVIATAGDNHIGGEDFNKRIVDLLLEKFKTETNLDLKEDPLALAKIDEAVEKAKIELSVKESSRIHIPFISADETGPKDIDFEITRDEFEKLILDYINRSIELCRQVLSEAELASENIDRIILVGGSSRIPFVKESLRKFFNHEIDHSINPEEAVAKGAALQGAIVSGDLNGVVLVDVNPISMGIEVESGYFVPIIERNQPIPTSARRIFTTVADSQKNVEIHIMQGESIHSKNNISLGKFKLESVRQASKGEPRIEVTFELDVNGILHVNALDMDTQNVQGISIVNPSRMTEEEIQEMRTEHNKNYQEEIQMRKSFESALKLKTKAETILSKIDSLIPVTQGESVIRLEINEIMEHMEKSVKEASPEKAKKSVERLEFIMSELNAGTYQKAEIHP